MRLKVNDIETFRQVVSEMMAYRNRRTRRSDKKIKITSVETDEQIIVENLQGRFKIGVGAKRFGRFEEEVWSHKVFYNKESNTLTFENAINEMGEELNPCYDLGETKVTFLTF